MSHEKSPTPCSQEPRLAHLEAAVTGINTTLNDVKDLLKSSIQADERINTLQKENHDQEKRLRRLEQTQAAGRWLERVAWILVASGLGWLFHSKG